MATSNKSNKKKTVRTAQPKAVPGSAARKAATRKVAPAPRKKAGPGRAARPRAAASRPAAGLLRARIDVDASRGEPLRRIWRYVGYDEPNYTYTENGRTLLGKLGSMNDAPYFIRCHFLLCTGDGTGRLKWGSSNVYTEDPSGRPVYSWTIIDRIFDTILAAGCRPFVELGFMPQALTTAPAGMQYDDPRNGGWRFPPKDFEKWKGLMAAIGEHCLKRYGLREVSGWYWELWNEPDIFYWQGGVDGYCRFYDYTEAGLHSTLPQAILGGPSTTNPQRPEAGEFLRAFLEHCDCGTNAVTGARGTRLDLVTFHTKGGGYKVDHNASKQTPTMNTLIGHAAEGLRIISRFPAFAGREVNLSECDPDGWAAGTRHDNPNLNYRNNEYYASYVGCTACKMIDLGAGGPNRIDGMLTWAFQFEDRDLFEGFRTLSTNGIDKPSLNVFRLLARLGGMRIALRSDRSRDPASVPGGDPAGAPPDISGIATRDQAGRIQVFVCSHHDDWDVRTASRVEIRLSGLEAGRRYRLTARVIDERNANAYTAWVAMGRPARATRKQAEALAEAALLRSRELPRVVAARGGSGALTVEVRSHAVCLVELDPER
jgi:xylan 1,4-beta-xylosidase